MENIKLERVLNLLLGASWSFLTFGTAFIFILLYSSSTIFLTIISTFSVFFFTSILVVFLESLKVQLKQNREVEEILDYIRESKKDKSLDISLDKESNEKE